MNGLIFFVGTKNLFFTFNKKLKLIKNERELIKKLLNLIIFYIKFFRNLIFAVV